jgi:type VI secretion system protein ImpE
MMEAVIEGRYVWIPFIRIQSLVAGPPANLRDLVWAPIHFTWTNGGRAAGFVPVRYPGTEQIGDDAARLSRSTAWLEPVAGWFHGVGQRTLSTDQADYALLDIRMIEFTQTSEAKDTTIHG